MAEVCEGFVLYDWYAICEKASSEPLERRVWWTDSGLMSVPGEMRLAEKFFCGNIWFKEET
jgi:hypothetical protein